MASSGSAIKYTTLPPDATYLANPSWMEGVIGAPPPKEKMPSKSSSMSSTTSLSSSRNSGSPYFSKYSGIRIPASCSISLSASANGRFIIRATSLPTRVLPAPIMPMITATGLRIPAMKRITSYAQARRQCTVRHCAWSRQRSRRRTSQAHTARWSDAPLPRPQPRPPEPRCCRNAG